MAADALAKVTFYVKQYWPFAAALDASGTKSAAVTGKSAVVIRTLVLLLVLCACLLFGRALKLPLLSSAQKSSSTCHPARPVQHANSTQGPQSTNSSRPFNASQFNTAKELLQAHKRWQAQTLQDALQAAAAGTPFVPPKAVVLKQVQAGWGNRLPSIVTGLLMAMFTDRVFLMKHDNNINDFLDFHWELDYSKYTALYSDACTCSVELNRLTNPGLNFCADPNTADLPVIEYLSWDYDMPLLEVNPALQATMQRLFPAGNIYHEVATRVFSFSQLVQRTAAQYKPMADDCLVGVQMRYKKKREHSRRVSVTDFTAQFAGIAKSLAGNQPGNVFVAADVAVYSQIAALLPGRTVWWSKESQSSIRNINDVGNPGTDLSAFVDIYLLTRCKHLVCTAASTFGPLAAAYANIVPVYAIRGRHETPYYKPYFWRALNSEPQMYKAGHSSLRQLSKANIALLSAHHQYWLQMQQWHFK